jgi:hypothetical protein
MKKLILTCFFASSVFANDCSFWFSNAHKSTQIMLMSFEDGDLQGAIIEGNLSLDFHRRGIASCAGEDRDLLIEGRSSIRGLISEFEKLIQKENK